jgi:hypothetical protein
MEPMRILLRWGFDCPAARAVAWSLVAPSLILQPDNARLKGGFLLGMRNRINAANALMCESGFVTLSQIARRVPVAKLWPRFRVYSAYLGSGAPSCALASTTLFSYSCDNSHPATAQSVRT